jgi:hypothetical protein
MGRAIKFDVSQFMNEWGGITEVPAPERPTAAFLRGIVRWVTRLEATVPMHTNVTCRHVSGPSSCGGQIAAHIMPGAKKIRYICEECGEIERILEWDLTPWDMRGLNRPGISDGGTTPAQRVQRAPDPVPLVLTPLGPIEKKILEYLRLNPDAGDNLDGIYTVWLSGEAGKLTISEVQEALDNLERNGLVSILQDSSGRKHYSRSTRRNN